MGGRGRWNNRIYRSLPAALTQKGRLRYAPSEGYRVLDRQVSPIVSTPCRDLVAGDATPWLADRFRRFFVSRATAQGKPVFLHKFTGWPRVGFIQAVFPAARFIHIVRDGRAVANSWLQMSWWQGYQGPDHWQWGPLPEGYEGEWRDSGRSFPLLAGILWKLLLDAFQQAAHTVAEPRWLEVRYEDVIAAPRKAFEIMLGFSGLEFDHAFEKGISKYTFETSRSEAFRRDLDADSLAMLTSSLRAPLQLHGYTA